MVQCVHHCAVRHHEVVRSGLAYEARKAPGGAYMHNIFHQSEHIICMLRRALEENETPDVVLWPYRTMAWSRELLGAVLPRVRWIETCCGPTNVRAAWYQGRRRACGCYQRVCPLQFERFWSPAAAQRMDRDWRRGNSTTTQDRAPVLPHGRGSKTHDSVRAIVRAHCGIDEGGHRATARTQRRRPRSVGQGEHEARVRVRLLERAPKDGRQFEDRDLLLASIRHAAGTGYVDIVRAMVPAAAVEVDRAAVNASASVLCDQVRWFAGAEVVVLAHGAATTNAIFADPGALVIDVAPYAYRHEPNAPSEYYEALLEGTDITYHLLHTARPGAALPSASPKSALAAAADVERCRQEKACRTAYRGHCCMRLDRTGLEQLQSLIIQHTGRA